MPDTERLDTLETRIAFQDQTLEELNAALAAQWKEIDRLTREVARLAERVANAEQSAGAEAGEEPPPPHY